MQKRCRCGLPSIGGLATPLCCRHYHERQWGKDWAEKCAASTITTVRDRQTGDIKVYRGLFEDEAVRNAYVQTVLNDYNTWQYRQYNEVVQRSGQQYWADRYQKGPRQCRRFVLQKMKRGEEPSTAICLQTGGQHEESQGSGQE